MEKGYLYVATGEKYLEEFEVSCASLKKHHPDARVTLVTDKVYVPQFLDVDIVLCQAFLDKPYLYKINSIALSPYKKTFFIDTDTFFCDGCDEIFRLLDYFDLCIVPCNNDNSDILDENNNVVKGITPYNTGVIAFRQNDRIDALFRHWKEAYIRHFDDYIHDQPPFMEALLSVDIKTLTLQSIYNVRTPYPMSFISKAVKIIHGRHNDFSRIERKLNKYKDYDRVWLPRYERVIVHRRTWIFRYYMSLNPNFKNQIKKIIKPIVLKLGLRNYR